MSCEPAEPAGVLVLPRRDTENAAKRAHQLVGRRADAPAERREPGWRVARRVELPADLAHQPDLRVGGRRLTGPAAPARPEAGLLGRFGDRKERHLCPAGSPAGARGPAIDPGGPGRIDERAVVAAVVRPHDTPAARRGEPPSDNRREPASRIIARPLPPPSPSYFPTPAHPP